jgi:hypothetical protein
MTILPLQQDRPNRSPERHLWVSAIAGEFTAACAATGHQLGSTEQQKIREWLLGKRWPDTLSRIAEFAGVATHIIIGKAEELQAAGWDMKMLPRGRACEMSIDQEQAR